MFMKSYWRILLKKIVSYLGFCQKSGAIVYGLDNLQKTKKRIYIILTCPSLGENSLKKVSKLALEKNIQVFETSQPLNLFLNKENCKIIGILNNELSNAIKGCNDMLKNLEVNLVGKK